MSNGMNAVPADAGSERLLIISADAHAGPRLKEHLRGYCPERYLQDFDDFASYVDAVGPPRPLIGCQEDFDRTKACPGQNDPAARLRDMDADGIAAEVIFAGGENDEYLPFIGAFGFDAGSPTIAQELRAVGCNIWNRWLADFVSEAPERHIGVMQVPIWDVDAAVREIEWGHSVGLRSVNFPAPRPDYKPYNDPSYKPLWEVCESLGIPLNTHGGGGEESPGVHGQGGRALHLSETHWLSRRALGQMIFGGVFERHPRLKLVFTEQRVTAFADTIRDFDSLYCGDFMYDVTGGLPKPPSEYWKANCFVAGSFMASYEVARREEIGIRNLLWGADYPHTEGTWPYTMLALRNTFADVPIEEARQILGDNAFAVFDLDRGVLSEVARRIGPTLSQLRAPVDVTMLPQHRGMAFRAVGSWS